MATTRRASTVWNGNLVEGTGEVTLESSGIGTFPVSWSARTEEPNGVTSPEELIAAAQATCYAMSVSLELTNRGTPPTRLQAAAEVDFQKGEGITGIRLFVEGEAPGVDAAGFKDAAEAAQRDCPVSRALAAVPSELTVR